jgi:hypothetical protein
MKQSTNSRFIPYRIALGLATLAGFSLCSLTPSANAAVFVRDSRTSVQGPCLDVRGAATTPGTPIQNYTCNAGVAQQWFFEGLQIVGIGSNGTTGFNCVWTYGFPAVGTPIVLAPCSAAPAEFSDSRWYYLNNQIVNYYSGLCLDGSGVIGTRATLHACNGSPAQTWAIRS